MKKFIIITLILFLPLSTELDLNFLNLDISSKAFADKKAQKSAEKAAKSEAKSAEKAAKSEAKAAEKAAKEETKSLTQNVKAPKGASKQEKEEVKSINKSLKETRKLENKIAKAKNEEQIQKALDNFNKKVSKINNGQKVSTYVKVAKSLGLNASIGALQANFGTPQETGILG